MSIPRETVEQRKALPLASGVLDYFPDALLVVAEVSRVGNEQHHPGEPLHWDKSKSSDEADALLRHLLDRGTYDTDGLRHSGKVAWRALALLQRELDAESYPQPDLTPDVEADKFDIAEHFPYGGPLVEPWGTGDGPVFVCGRPFLGYGGTGDRNTRSDSENLAYGLVRDGYGGWSRADEAGFMPCLGCGFATSHALDCPMYR